MSKPPCDPAEIVGLSEIARLFRVKKSTVIGWVRRASTAVERIPFPGADGRVGRTSWWFLTHTILPWGKATGRLPR